MGQVSASQFDINRIYTPKMREEKIEPYQDRVETATAAVERIASKSEALSVLQVLESNLLNAITPFTRGKTGVFDQRQAGILTNDVGSGTDYIGVSTVANATKGQFSVRVNQLAKAASMVVNKTDRAVPPTITGFGANENLATLIGGVNPKVTIGLPGAEGGIFVVNINATDNISDLATNINTAFQLNQVPLTATASQRSDGDYSLVIKNSHTGSGSFTCAFSNNGAAYATDNKNDAGVDANITVDGVLKSSRSNTFNDVVTGVSIQLKKPNDSIDTTKNLIVDVTDGGTQVVKKLENVIAAYNAFVDFAAIHRPIITGVNSVIPKDAILFSSRVLDEATTIVNALVSSAPGASGTITSLNDIGLSVDKATKKLEIFDLVKLYDATVYKNDEIKKLFQGNAVITKVGPTTSELKFSTIVLGTVLPRNVLGSNIVLNDDGAGNVTFTLNGSAPAAVTINGNTISFPGTPLKGLLLNYNQTGAGPQSFNIVVSQGLADRYMAQSLQFGANLAKEVLSVARENTELQRKEEVANEALTKAQKDIDDMVQRLDIQSIFAEQQDDRLNDMLDIIFE